MSSSSVNVGNNWFTKGGDVEVIAARGRRGKDTGYCYSKTLFLLS